jgi:hypothetical protein
VLFNEACVENTVLWKCCGKCDKYLGTISRAVTKSSKVSLWLAEPLEVRYSTRTIYEVLLFDVR